MNSVIQKGDRLCFSDDVKSAWRVRKDDCGDDFIRLNGRKALGSSGLDHIYPISLSKIGLWVTSGTLDRLIRQLKSQISGLELEQLGQGEAVLSAPVEQLDELCRAANARARRTGQPATDEQRQRLAAIRSRLKKSSEKQAISA